MNSSSQNDPGTPVDLKVKIAVSHFLSWINIFLYLNYPDDMFYNMSYSRIHCSKIR